MQTLWTVIGRELITRPRHRWFYVRRLGLLLAISAVLALVLWNANEMRDTVLGLSIARIMSRALVLIAMLIAPYMAANDLLEEKEQRTLPVLWMTDMTSGSILLGRLFSAMLLSFGTVILLLPLLLLGVSLGGVGPQQILHLFAILASLIFMGTSYGLLCGAVARSERQMRGLLVLGIIVVLVALPLIASAYAAYGRYEKQVLLPPEMWMRLVAMLSSFYAAEQLFRISAFNYFQSYGATWWNVGFNLGAGGLSLLLAAMLFPWTVRNFERPSLMQRIKAAIARRRGQRLGRTSPAIFGNPLFWKDYHKLQGGTARIWLRTAMICGCFLLLILVGALLIVYADRGTITLADLGKTLSDDGFVTGAAGSTLMFSMLVLPLVMLSGASRMFSVEKRARALEVMMTSDLSSREIVMGKYLALAAGAIPWLVVMAFSFLVLNISEDFFLLNGHSEELAALCGFACYYLGGIYAGTAIAGWASLRYSRNVGFVLVVVGTIVYHIVLAMMADVIDLDSPTALFFINAMIFVGIGTTVLSTLVSGFRVQARASMSE